MQNKKIIVFDLDGTLTLSKSPMDVEMAELLARLLVFKDVAVMSGAHFPQYQKQFLNFLNSRSAFSRLHLLPTCGACLFNYNNGPDGENPSGAGWQNVYKEELSAQDKEKIIQAFNQVMAEISYQPEKVFGDILEDRGGTQISFSALGQAAPRDLKKVWDPDFKKRLAMKVLLDKKIPDFDVKVAGTTSIDVTRQGIDKAYGIKKIETVLGFTKPEMLYVGDALFPGGNDYSVKEVGVDCVQVGGPEETKELIRKIIK